MASERRTPASASPVRAAGGPTPQPAAAAGGGGRGGRAAGAAIPVRPDSAGGAPASPGGAAGTTPPGVPDAAVGAGAPAGSPAPASPTPPSAAGTAEVRGSEGGPAGGGFQGGGGGGSAGASSAPQSAAGGGGGGGGSVGAPSPSSSIPVARAVSAGDQPRVPLGGGVGGGLAAVPPSVPAWPLEPAWPATPGAWPPAGQALPARPAPLGAWQPPTSQTPTSPSPPPSAFTPRGSSGGGPSSGRPPVRRATRADAHSLTAGRAAGSAPSRSPSSSAEVPGAAGISGRPAPRRPAPQADSEGIIITIGDAHFILRAAQEVYKQHNPGQSSDPSHADLQAWCNSPEASSVNLSRAINEAINKQIRDGTRVVVTPTMAGNEKKFPLSGGRGAITEKNTAKGIQLHSEGAFDPNSSVIVRIPRLDGNGKHIPDAFDVVELVNGKPVSIVIPKDERGNEIGRSQLDMDHLKAQMGKGTGLSVLERGAASGVTVVTGPSGPLPPPRTPGARGPGVASARRSTEQLQ